MPGDKGSGHRKKRLFERLDAESVACADYQSAAMDGERGEQMRARWPQCLLLGMVVPCKGKALKRVTSCID